MSEGGNALAELEGLRARLEAEAEDLSFEAFGFAEAWAIGQDLVAEGLAGKLPIAIDVSANGQVLFHAALPGSSPDNDQWILRKNRVALRFHRSSLYIATVLRLKGKTIEEKYGLSEADYAPYGGAVPVNVRGAGVIGTVTVSGLADTEDHRMASEAMRRRITRA